MATSSISKSWNIALDKGVTLNLNNVLSVPGTITMQTYGQNCANAPSSGQSGYCFTFLNADSAAYGRQVAISNQNIYSRKLQNGAWNP